MADPRKAPTLLVLALLTGLFIALLTPRMLQVRDLRERSDKLDRELQLLKRQNDALENELRLLKDDPVYLEKVARSQFNKAKEGEVVYKVVREGQNTR